MKYLIIGKEGSDKHAFAETLAEKGFKVAKSCTTRPKLYDSDDSHIFITSENKNSEKYKNPVAATVINGNSYFLTKEIIENNDIIIIRPDGIKAVAETLPDTSFHIIVMNADEEIRLKIAERKDGKDIGIESEESKMFDEFWNKFNDEKTPFAENCACVHTIDYDYEQKTLDDWAQYIFAYSRKFNRVMQIIDALADNGTLERPCPGKINLMTRNLLGDIIAKQIPDEVFTDTVMNDNEGFNRIMCEYLYLDELPIL